MGIFIGDTTPSKIFVGDTAISKVFVGTTKVRPTSFTGFTDYFSGSSLNTDIWDSYIYGNQGSITVNNGLTLYVPSTNQSYGPAIYTKETFKGTENKITYTITGVQSTSNYADTGLQINLLGDSGGDASWVSTATYPPAFSMRFKTYAKCLYSGSSKTQFTNQNSTYYPATGTSVIYKYELTPSDRKVKIYINGTLWETFTYGNYNYVGQPLLGLSTVMWTTVTSNVGSVKIEVE